MPFPTDPEKAVLARQRLSEAAKKRFARPEELLLLRERALQQFSDPKARERQSELAKAQWNDPEKRETGLQGKRDFWDDPEKSAVARQRMSVSAKKRFENLEERDKLTAIRTEVFRRPASRAKRSAISKQLYREHPEMRIEAREKTLQQFSDPEARKMQVELSIQQWSDPVKREALLTGRNDFLNSPESVYMRDRARETLAQTMLQPGYHDAVARGIASSKKFSKTNIELLVESLLQALDIEYEAQKHIGRWVADFYIPSKNLVVECDGDYWHSLPEVQAKDARKDADLLKRGYQVLRLSGSQILQGDFASLKQFFIA